jgi:hypothetical protein
MPPTKQLKILSFIGNPRSGKMQVARNFAMSNYQVKLKKPKKVEGVLMYPICVEEYEKPVLIFVA